MPSTITPGTSVRNRISVGAEADGERRGCLVRVHVERACRERRDDGDAPRRERFDHRLRRRRARLPDEAEPLDLSCLEADLVASEADGGRTDGGAELGVDGVERLANDGEHLRRRHAATVDEGRRDAAPLHLSGDLQAGRRARRPPARRGPRAPSARLPRRPGRRASGRRAASPRRTPRSAGRSRSRGRRRGTRLAVAEPQLEVDAAGGTAQLGDEPRRRPVGEHRGAVERDAQAIGVESREPAVVRRRPGAARTRPQLGSRPNAAVLTSGDKSRSAVRWPALPPARCYRNPDLEDNRGAFAAGDDLPSEVRAHLFERTCELPVRLRVAIGDPPRARRTTASFVEQSSTEIRLSRPLDRRPQVSGGLPRRQGVVGGHDGEHRREARMDHLALRRAADEAVARGDGRLRPESVVRIAAAASSPPSGASAAAAASTPARSSGIGSRGPITPVESTTTSSARRPSNDATRAAVLRASSSPPARSPHWRRPR